MSFFVNREVCETCSGAKTIVCCSCFEEEECHEIECPSCHGAGVHVSYNTGRIIGTAVLAAVAVLGVMVAMFAV